MMTFTQIGRREGVTRQRAWTIFWTGMSKLRSRNREEALQLFAALEALKHGSGGAEAMFPAMYLLNSGSRTEKNTRAKKCKSESVCPFAGAPCCYFIRRPGRAGILNCNLLKSAPKAAASRES